MKNRAEGVVSRIISEVIQECSSRGEDVSETVAAYMVKAVVLDPDSGFLPDKPLKKEDVHRLIKLCANRLMDKEHPTVDTIKMQVAFELNHVTKNEFLEEHHRVMQTRLEPVTQEAIEARGRTRDELQDVYRRIISAVLLQSGLGSPTNIEVVRETTAALQSIFPQSDLGTFLALNASQKRNQISEFTGIVIGIRLFNKDSGRGGAGIDDLPYLLAQGIPMTLNTLQDELKTAKELAAVYASLFLKICAIDPTPGSLSSSNITAAAAESMGITPELLRIAVVNARQYETFLLVLERDLIEMTANVERLCNNFNARMKELHDLIRDRQSVPSMDVYPGFMELSRIWGDLQDAMVMLSALTTTLSTIQSLFVGRRLKWQREKLLGLISDSEVIYDDRIKKHGPISEAEQGNFTWIFPDPQTDISKLNIEFNGFCAWSLIKYQGLLVRPDLSLGCLFIPSENRMYAFSSAEAIQDFVLAMDRMLSALPEIMRRLPELIQFLKIGQSNSKTVSGSRDASFIEKPYGQVDAEMQTEVHPIESYIDTNYEWNEWELRKKALKLANLRRKATRSVQTILSNWRRDNATQVYLLKNSSTSSKEDGYTQVPKPSVFQYGLRGCGGIDAATNAEAATKGNQSWCTLYRPTNFTTVDLTIPVEQQLLASAMRGLVKW